MPRRTRQVEDAEQAVEEHQACELHLEKMLAKAMAERGRRARGVVKFLTPCARQVERQREILEARNDRT